MSTHEHLEEASSQYENWSAQGKAMASDGPLVEYVLDPTIPPLKFENGLEQMRYTDAYGKTITLPLLDELRKKLPTPDSVLKRRYQEFIDQREIPEVIDDSNVVYLFPEPLADVGDDNS